MQEQSSSTGKPLQGKTLVHDDISGSIASGAGRVYDSLLNAPSEPESRDLSRRFLRAQLQRAQQLPCEMPLEAAALSEWIESQALAVGDEYERYLESRRSGEPRRYFRSRSHALSFIRGVAPTKLVDGAWLYGILQRWQDPRFHPLIRTYLEELGEGDPAQNHVLLYRQMLSRYGGSELPELSDDHYVQGAVQLALAYHSEEFLPELLGYNLGYEQVRTHLLITAFELNELDVDPYYFTLHITIDNASSGHSRKAVTALVDLIPVMGDSAEFLSRVANGFRLNDVGLSATDVIQSFNLEQELEEMLERKRIFGRHMHSDFSLVDGRTVNQWLEEPGQMRAFLGALEGRRWIKRHQDPGDSRLWQLVEGEGAQMYGVFAEDEKQLLYDWIAGDWLEDGSAEDGEVPQDDDDRPRVFRRARRMNGRTDEKVDDTSPGDLDQGITELTRELEQLPEEQRVQRLIELLSPSSHMTTAGLAATRLFSDSLD